MLIRNNTARAAWLDGLRRYYLTRAEAAASPSLALLYRGLAAQARTLMETAQ